MKRAVALLARAVWLSACVAALVYAHLGYQGSSDWRLEEGLAFEMMILAFPASLVVVAGLVLIGGVLHFLGLALPTSSRAEMTVTWLFFAAAGYFQWFVLLPRLWRNKQRAQR
jgi:hypothetical protein